MAKKKQSQFECKDCGHTEPRWLGRCPGCGSWNSFIEQAPLSEISGHEEPANTPLPISAIRLNPEFRFDTGLEEINRVLGGGAIRGSSILVGGEPGIGKSTLMLQIAASLKTGGRVLYVAGEESSIQLKMRASRLQIDSDTIEVYCETVLERILETIARVKPVIVIIDSIQTINSGELGSVPGSVSQVKHCAAALNECAKTHSLTLFLIGHVTKEGVIAGPKVVEHLVDTVLYFDQSQSELRILRAVKNRFGSTDEIGLFSMGEQGLNQVNDPSSLFLEHREGPPPPGVVVAPVYEGTRVLLVEIQSLVVPAKGGISRVFSDRIDSRRIFRLAAVLEKHLRLPFTDVDMYINIAGGIKLTEVGIDLPVCLALYSARQNLALPDNTVIIGEVSLAGEIRAVPRLESRCKAAREMGLSTFIGPLPKTEETGIRYMEAKSIQEAVRKVFSLP